jgi:hypothetical protein
VEPTLLGYFFKRNALYNTQFNIKLMCLPQPSFSLVWFISFDSILLRYNITAKVLFLNRYFILTRTIALCFFFAIAQYNSDTRNTCTLTHMKACTQTLPLWASSKTGLTNPQDWWSHYRRLTLDGNVTYHWKHNVVKLCNIRFHGESNPGPDVLLRLLCYVMVTYETNARSSSWKSWWSPFT